ncbi:hypothetical protein [Luteolibacter soli]|uniref:Uncharacterized protein n=1 Tax=Luteolibacter soli TaxID=3135280 RepID=A0ABU9B0G1_9BACT
MPFPPRKLRFSRNRAGAAYPLKADEVIQLRSPLHTASGMTGRLILRVTQDGNRERAEYWLGAPDAFISASDELTDDLMRHLEQALVALAAALKGYRPDVDANDSGRCISFWSCEQPATVFVPSHPTSYQPPEACLAAFDQVWSLVIG